MSSQSLERRVWRPPRMIQQTWLRWSLVALGLGYLVLATLSIDIDIDRILRGLPRAWLFIKGFLMPDFLTRGHDIIDGVLESLAITVASTVLGVAISIVIGFGAARNIVPLPVYLLCRGIITVSRTFQEVIIAIFFVALFGFGPFAGVLTLAFGTIGFLAKLLAEEIEAMDMASVEALRATGAGWLKIMVWSVLPQVSPRLIGLSLYRFDINFRESAVIGVVGAGGIGDTLSTTFDRYEYASSSAILLVIIAIVFFCEISSGYIRRKLL